MSTNRIEPADVKQPPVGEAAYARPKTGWRVQNFTPYFFLAPYLALFLIFVIIPAIFGLWISLHNWNYLLANKPFIGVQNYQDLVTPGSPTFSFFWQSMSATAQFTVYSVPALLILPLLAALVLNQKFRGQRVFRAIYFAPYVLGVAVVGILWRFILEPNFGLMNFYLDQTGLTKSAPWTTGLPYAWIALVLATVWWTLGFNTVIYLAGLQNIDRTLYEAAKVDGANGWERFVNVTLPGLRPVLLFVLTITILSSANVFGQTYLITQGAPGNDTRSIIQYIAFEGLNRRRMGSASAMSYVLAIVLAVISIINFKFFNRRGEE